MKRLLAALLFTAPALLAQERATGYIPLTAAEYARQPGWRAPAVGARTRAQVDLRAYMPPVGDQGDQSSCVGWTVAYACGGYYEGIRRGRKPTGPDLQLSPAYVYNQITIPGKDGMGNGARIWEALRLWRRQGIAPLESMPYDARSARARPSVEASKDARSHTILDYGRLTTGRQIKLALSLFKPVAVGIRTTPRFHRPEEWTHYSKHDDETGIAEQEEYWEKEETKDEDRRFGGHAITLVGYDDSRQAFLAQNSWGSKWADNGYCWMRFDLFETIKGSGTFCHAAYIVQSRSGVHPRAYEWMYGRTGVQFHTLKWREKGRWHFSVEVSPFSRRSDDIARIEWARGARTATGSRFEGTADRPGLVEVAAIVHLKDGTVLPPISWSILLTEREGRDRKARIRVRTDYWGRQKALGRLLPHWRWVATIRANEDYDAIWGVVWHLGKRYSDPDVRSNDRETGFRVSGKAHEEEFIAATVYFRDGPPSELRRKIRFSGKPIAELRIRAQVMESTPRGAGVSLQLLGPLRDRWTVERVVYRLPDGRTQSVSSEEGFSFKLDLYGQTGGQVAATLHFEDGTTRSLRATAR